MHNQILIGDCLKPERPGTAADLVGGPTERQQPTARQSHSPFNPARRAARLIISALLLASPLSAQFADLTAPGHGDDLYYALQIPQPVMEFFGRASFYASSSTAGPVYRVGSVPPTLFASSPAPLFPPGDLYSTNTPWFISPYYLMSHPQFSRDLRVAAFTGRRVCLDGQGCLTVKTTQTVVQGLTSGTVTFDGRGWLSGNGRYLLIQPEVSPANAQQPAWIDLETGQQQSLSVPVSASPNYRDSTGRVIADDGTAVLGGCAGSSLCLYRGGELIRVTGVAGIEPVIDAAARTVIYTAKTIGGQQYLRAYDVTNRQDKPFVQPNGDSYAPSISADGKRVMFLSTAQWGTTDPPGTTQLYAINLDGTGFQELTSGSEPAGVQQYTMSDDGQVAWYLSGDGKLVKIDLSAGQPSRTIFRAAAIDLSATLVPGSAVTLSGANLEGVILSVNGAPTPLLSVTPNSIVFQVPWETPAGVPATIRAVTHAGTADESIALATVTPVISRPWLIPAAPCQQTCDLGGGAIHQDWSGFVTPEHPAVAGEILHFYGTGFGPVNPQGETGIPAPTCTADPAGSGPPTVLYFGLAPGFVGFYQMDVQLPSALYLSGLTQNTAYPRLSLSCGEGVIGVFAIQPTPR